MWGTALASKHLGIKSSMDHPVPALFQPHTAPIHPMLQWSRRVILNPHPPGASLLPTFPACARTVAITWTPPVMFWHHQSALAACTRCLSSGLTVHAQLKQNGREHRAALLTARLPLCHRAWPRSFHSLLVLGSFKPLTSPVFSQQVTSLPTVLDLLCPSCEHQTTFAVRAAFPYKTSKVSRESTRVPASACRLMALADSWVFSSRHVTKTGSMSSWKAQV